MCRFKGGVNYIAQVLKRNTHLKVLNLSENRIDAVGLASLAEALVSSSLAWMISVMFDASIRNLALEPMSGDA
jgi:hypothetical protein